MGYTGGCYCGRIRYQAEGEPAFKAECHCRECQHISGGGPAFVMGVPVDGFRYTSGEPARFSRDDLPHAVTREFCSRCGTHLVTIPPASSGMELVMIKAGSLDDPAQYGGPEMVLYTSEKQDFHLLPEGIPAFEKFPSSVG